jgi:hypothetical protein
MKAIAWIGIVHTVQYPVEASLWAKPAWIDSNDASAKPVTAKEKRLPYTPW